MINRNHPYCIIHTHYICIGSVVCNNNIKNKMATKGKNNCFVKEKGGGSNCTSVSICN